jgi:peptidoglycan hydrolase CwlO-like protein
MSDVTPEKLELSQHQTRNWILVAVVAFLVLMVQGFFTYVITTTGTEVRETNKGLTELVSTVKVQQAQMSFLQTQVSDLQTAKKEATQVHQTYDNRLNSIEQRLALHDQWIQSQNKK